MVVSVVADVIPVSVVADGVAGCVCGGRGLDLRKYILNPDNRDVNMYDLISVTNHYGGLGGGHCKWSLLIYHLGQCSGNTANRTPTGMHVYVGYVCVCVCERRDAQIS